MAGYKELADFDGVFTGTLAGVDEAGRGPWAGPVVAAAVVLDRSKTGALLEVNDSKKLTEKKREKLFDIIIDASVTYSIFQVSNTVIDRINILEATMEAMKNAVAGLKVSPETVIVDGISTPQAPGAKVITVIDGDAKSLSIAAASILAKVYRDRIMREFDSIYPGYGFARHKGYGTAFHMKALDEKGVCPIHRVSYKPVAAIIKKKG
jgi:ribonuclease HII